MLSKIYYYLKHQKNKKLKKKIKKFKIKIIFKHKVKNNYLKNIKINLTK